MLFACCDGVVMIMMREAFVSAWTAATFRPEGPVTPFVLPSFPEQPRPPPTNAVVHGTHAHYLSTYSAVPLLGEPAD